MSKSLVLKNRDIYGTYEVSTALTQGYIYINGSGVVESRNAPNIDLLARDGSNSMTGTLTVNTTGIVADFKSGSTSILTIDGTVQRVDVFGPLKIKGNAVVFEVMNALNSPLFTINQTTSTIAVNNIDFTVNYSGSSKFNVTSGTVSVVAPFTVKNTGGTTIFSVPSSGNTTANLLLTPTISYGGNYLQLDTTLTSAVILHSTDPLYINTSELIFTGGLTITDGNDAPLFSTLGNTLANFEAIIHGLNKSLVITSNSITYKETGFADNVLQFNNTDITTKTIKVETTAGVYSTLSDKLEFTNVTTASISYTSGVLIADKPWTVKSTSATAFQVQNASSANIFTVDTTNNIVRSDVPLLVKTDNVAALRITNSADSPYLTVDTIASQITATKTRISFTDDANTRAFEVTNPGGNSFYVNTFNNYVSTDMDMSCNQNLYAYKLNPQGDVAVEGDIYYAGPLGALTKIAKPTTNDCYKFSFDSSLNWEIQYSMIYAWSVEDGGTVDATTVDATVRRLEFFNNNSLTFTTTPASNGDITAYVTGGAPDYLGFTWTGGAHKALMILTVTLLLSGTTRLVMSIYKSAVRINETMVYARQGTNSEIVTLSTTCVVDVTPNMTFDARIVLDSGANMTATMYAFVWTSHRIC